MLEEEEKKEGKERTPLSKNCRKTSDVCVEENERQEEMKPSMEVFLVVCVLGFSVELVFLSLQHVTETKVEKNEPSGKRELHRTLP